MSFEDNRSGYEPVDIGKGFSFTLGGLYINRERGRLAFGVGVDQCNPVGFCHGGALATFADAQILAVDAASQVHKAHHPTITLNVDYLDAAHLDEWVEMEVTLDRKTRRLFFTRGLMRVGDRVVARTNAVYRNTSPPDA